MHLFAVFCLICLVLAHCGHPGIQHISLQSLEKPAKLGGVSPLNVCSDSCISQNFISPQVQVQLQRSKWSKKQESEAGVYLIAQRWWYTFLFPMDCCPFFSSHHDPLQKNCFVSRWWQLKYFWKFSPRNLGQMNPFWLTFFRWVGEKPPTRFGFNGKNQAIWSNASPWRAPPRNGGPPTAFGGRLLGTKLSAGLTLGTRQKV